MHYLHYIAVELATTTMKLIKSIPSVSDSCRCTRRRLKNSSSSTIMSWARRNAATIIDSMHFCNVSRSAIHAIATWCRITSKLVTIHQHHQPFSVFLAHFLTWNLHGLRSLTMTFNTWNILPPSIHPLHCCTIKAKERIRELEKELESLQQKLNEQEDKSNKMYLHMYKKDCAAGPSTSRVSSLMIWNLHIWLKFSPPSLAGFDGTASRSLIVIVQLQRVGVDASIAGHKRRTRQLACKFNILSLSFPQQSGVMLLWRFSISI